MSSVFKKSNSLAFTLIEVLVVVAIIAIIVLAALPAFTAIVPQFELKSATNNISSLLRSARIQADNFQKPSRVVIDCRQNDKPCVAALFSAKFDDSGLLTGWDEIHNARRLLPKSVMIRANLGQNKVIVTDTSLTDVYWIVFLPTGEAITSHFPMQLNIQSTRKDLRQWEITINNGTGRVSQTRSSI